MTLLISYFLYISSLVFPNPLAFVFHDFLVISFQDICIFTSMLKILYIKNDFFCYKLVCKSTKDVKKKNEFEEYTL